MNENGVSENIKENKADAELCDLDFKYSNNAAYLVSKYSARDKLESFFSKKNIVTLITAFI